MQERRKFKRVPIETVLMIQLPSQSNIQRFGFKEISNPKSVNISMGGLQIKSDSELPKDLFIISYFSIEPDNSTLEIKGKVVWCEKGGHDKEYRVGIEFVDIHEKVKKILKEFIDK